MKRVFLVISMLMVGAANGAAPATSCPAGFVAVDEPFLTIEGGACPAGYTAVGVAETCLVASPTGSCMMFVPAATEYSDDIGFYEFTTACPLM